MSDSDTGGVGQAPPGPAARRRRRSRRSAAVVAVARAVFIAVGLVTAYYLLPLDERPTVGASVVLACGLLTVLLVFSMLQMAGGLLLVRVAARVPASAVQAGLHRKRREASTRPQSGAGRPEPESGP
ncbi:hypothetical protein [Streptomyces flaveolus]|uniref:hypothetical protein n=1 Tax=Streptomyces flaveolus TaxID=67297 RepID=UPI003328A6CD